ncbi:MAG TPA: hypothetical protein PLL64_05860 [Rhodothermales bacterium]|nr:hypothetical protein [Rhodothermales bacterium]
MTLLWSEILICLLLAFLLGLLIGWWIWSRRKETVKEVPADDTHWRNLEADLRAKLSAKDDELNGLRSKVNGLSADLSACNDKVAGLTRANADLSASAATSVMPAFPSGGATMVSGLAALTDEDEGLPSAPPELPTWMRRAEIGEKEDLKEIVGVGPFLEKKLNAYGIYTFRQVATLTKDNIKEVGATFGAFPDRIEREEWARQARELHAKYHGGEELPKFSN